LRGDGPSFVWSAILAAMFGLCCDQHHPQPPWRIGGRVRWRCRGSLEAP